MSSDDTSTSTPAPTPCTPSPYRIEVSPTLGRYLVATREIKQGELLLKERPLVVGPKAASIPVCLGCLAPRPKSQLFPCSRCSLAPMCSTECQDEPGHAKGECSLFQTVHKNNPDFKVLDNLQVVLPLRCFALGKDENTSKSWELLKQMESHEASRRESDIWQLQKERVIDLLHDLGILESETDASLMETICGILDVNSFELRGPNPALMTHPAAGERLRGVYLEAALLAHDCVGNTHISIDDSFNMTIHASLPIPEGEPIFFNYANSLECTPERQTRLVIGKYFTCSCRRCLDPTELGTYLSAILCPRCKEGMVTPRQDNPEELSWQCEGCTHTFHPYLLRTTLNQAWAAVEDADQTDTREMETLLKRLSRTFPPSSVVMVEVKQNLVALYRDIILREPSPSRHVFQRKIALCTELLSVLKAVEPGISRLKGITLYELHVPLVMLATREYDSGEITAEQLLARLETANATLKEAVSMLLYEPQNSPEGKLLRLAMDELRALRENIAQVKYRNENECFDGKKKGQRGRKTRK